MSCKSHGNLLVSQSSYLFDTIAKLRISAEEMVEMNISRVASAAESRSITSDTMVQESYQ